MNMEMKNGLSSILPIVNDDPEPVFQLLLLSADFRSCPKQVSEFRFVGFRSLVIKIKSIRIATGSFHPFFWESICSELELGGLCL